MQTDDAIKRIIDKSNRELFRKPNLIGTGIGYKEVMGRKTGTLCIVCSVEEKVAKKKLSRKQLIPPLIEGIKTDVQPTGIIRSLNLSSRRFRPAPGGVSVGHPGITSGTLGCVVKKNNKSYILSNNHVLACSNLASVGDLILQPGPSDGGRVPEDQIALLSEFVPIRFETRGRIPLISNALKRVLNFMTRISGLNRELFEQELHPLPNLADCAVAGPVYEHEVTGRIRGVGIPTGTVRGRLDMEVIKSGRTTGVTTGKIEQTDVTVRVSFGKGRSALFSDQLISSPMSMSGDSGAAVLNTNNDIVGLLFAGSSNTTIINRIQNIFNLLDLTV